MADTLKQAIEAGNQKFMDCFDNKDAMGIGKLYTEDCKIMPPGADCMMGRESVAKVFQGVMDQGSTKLVLAVDEVGPMGAEDMAYERSHFTFSDKDGKVTMQGKYVVVWKKVNGTYFLYIDIFNSNS